MCREVVLRLNTVTVTVSTVRHCLFCVFPLRKLLSFYEILPLKGFHHFAHVRSSARRFSFVLVLCSFRSSVQRIVEQFSLNSPASNFSVKHTRRVFFSLLLTGGKMEAKYDDYECFAWLPLKTSPLHF